MHPVGRAEALPTRCVLQLSRGECVLQICSQGAKPKVQSCRLGAGLVRSSPLGLSNLKRQPDILWHAVAGSLSTEIGQANTREVLLLQPATEVPQRSKVRSWAGRPDSKQSGTHLEQRAA